MLRLAYCPMSKQAQCHMSFLFHAGTYESVILRVSCAALDLIDNAMPLWLRALSPYLNDHLRTFLTF